MTAQTIAPITVDLAPALGRLALVIEAPIRTVRHLLRLAETVATANDVDGRTAMLTIAEAFAHAADHGPYADLIRDEMLAAELRARRLAEHLP